MPKLTRRRDSEAQQETWLIHYGDVRVGVIAERVGNPGSTPDLSEHTRGLAATLDQARAAFEAAWRPFLARRTEADFEEYRRELAFQAWKQAMWATGLKLPTQVVDGRAVCFCGAAIGIADMEAHVYAAHGIEA